LDVVEDNELSVSLLLHNEPSFDALNCTSANWITKLGGNLGF
jgi:hypothetical protein